MFPAAGIVGHEVTKCEFNRCRNIKCATSVRCYLLFSAVNFLLQRTGVKPQSYINPILIPNATSCPVFLVLVLRSIFCR